MIAIFSMVILSAVQFFLLYNTYKIQDEHYFINEKSIINDDYTLRIANDKIFPGGAKIIDDTVMENMDTLEYLYNYDRKAFQQYSKSVCLNIFKTLKQKNNLDSILAGIIKKRHLPQKYSYAVCVRNIDIAFHVNRYIKIYPFTENPNDNQEYIVGGQLRHINKQNLITDITVSTPIGHSYRFEFSLHLENANRNQLILLSTLPIFMLSLLSIISIIVLFYITYTNWIRQKKLAEMQSDFINSITHEFNTPLTAIMVANKSLQNEKIVPQNGYIKQLTGVIQRQTVRLNELFGQVLNLTITNEAQLKIGKFNINDIVAQTISDYQLKIENQNVILSYQSDVKDREVRLDAFWLTTMLQNIIENGIKYNDKNEKNIAVVLRQSQNAILLIVEDNGIGMSPNTKNKIFEKFYRHNNSAASAGGLGLGLFYVKQCINMHKWSIEIDSTETKGSKFTISIK